MSLKHDTERFLVGLPVGQLTLRGVLADTLGGVLIMNLKQQSLSST